MIRFIIGFILSFKYVRYKILYIIELNIIQCFIPFELFSTIDTGPIKSVNFI